MSKFKDIVAETGAVAQQHYAPRTELDCENFEILDWGDKASQFKRFEVLSTQLNLTGVRLLDIGSGLGDLYVHLTEVGNLPALYVGTDLVKEMVEKAKTQLPLCLFYCCDVLAENPTDQPFDVVYCSGVFNLRTPDNLGFLNYALHALKTLATKEAKIVFNFLHNRTETKYNHCFYYDPAVVKQMASEFYEEVKVIENYLPNDFTLIATTRKSN